MGKVHGGQKLFKTSRENTDYGKGTRIEDRSKEKHREYCAKHELKLND
jgi:hypothetical protein